MDIHNPQSEYRKLFRLLVKAAGVEEHKVRAIECRCACDEPPTFQVEMLGKPEHLRTVLNAPMGE